MESLAKDSILIICEYLSSYDLVNFSRSSKRFHGLCRPLILQKNQEEEYEHQIIGQLTKGEVVYMQSFHYPNQQLELSPEPSDYSSTYMYIVTQICNKDGLLPSIGDLIVKSRFILNYQYSSSTDLLSYRRIYIRNINDLLLLIKILKSHNYKQFIYNED